MGLYDSRFHALSTRDQRQQGNSPVLPGPRYTSNIISKQTFSVKGCIVNIFSFVRQMVFVTTIKTVVTA